MAITDVSDIWLLQMCLFYDYYRCRCSYSHPFQACSDGHTVIPRHRVQDYTPGDD